MFACISVLISICRYQVVLCLDVIVILNWPIERRCGETNPPVISFPVFLLSGACLIRDNVTTRHGQRRNESYPSVSEARQSFASVLTFMSSSQDNRIDLPLLRTRGYIFERVPCAQFPKTHDQSYQSDSKDKIQPYPIRHVITRTCGLKVQE